MVFAYQCPLSVFVFFPEDVYHKLSSSVVLPQLLECLPRDKVKVVQFLRGGVVRLTFVDAAVRDDVLARGILFQEIQLRVVSAMSEVRVLYVRDLPIEVPDDVVSSFLSSFGDVVHVTRSTYKDFPSVCDGNRVVRIVLKQDVPYFVRIADCNCRVWYARQPVQCVICREFGHVSRDCRLSGRCRRCHQQGHVARMCTQAWGSSRASVSATDDGDQSAIDVDDGDGHGIDDAGDAPPASPSCVADDGDGDGDVNEDASGDAPSASPSLPPASDVMSVTPDVSVRPSPKASVSPKVSVSPKSTKLIQLRVVCGYDPVLHDLLAIIGHVVTESVLERINVPMNSPAFLTNLTKLTKEKLDSKTQQRVNRRLNYKYY